MLSIPLVLAGIFLVYKALYDKVQNDTRN
jgi:hypothetical protein